jgi:murein DD-endopeptidase MepM/ murein hydrolase activator NlpD
MAINGLVFINPTGLQMRNDSGGQGHYGASRNRIDKKTKKRITGSHNGIDILSVTGQQVRAPISGKLRVAAPNSKGVHSGFGITSPDGEVDVKVFYVTPDKKLIGTDVVAGDNVAVAQDLQLPKSGYGASVLDHVHVEIRIKGTAVDPKPYLLGS